MAEIQTNRLHVERERLLSLVRRMDSLCGEIGRRALQLTESCANGVHDDDGANRLAVGRSLIFMPPVELVEEEHQFGIRMAVPGLEPSQLRVSILPDAIIVDGDLSVVHVAPEDRAVFSGKLLRRVNLPQGVKAYAAKVVLKNGILELTVKKITQADEPAEYAAPPI